MTNEKLKKVIEDILDEKKSRFLTKSIHSRTVSSPNWMTSSNWMNSQNTVCQRE